MADRTDWSTEFERELPQSASAYLDEAAGASEKEGAKDTAPPPLEGRRLPPRERPDPKAIDAEWQKFLRRHGHLDEDGRIIHTERLQREVGFTGLKSLYHAALHGDIRAAEVLVRTCLVQPRAPLEVRVRQMDKSQLAGRERELLAALPTSMRGEVEEALARAAGPVIEGTDVTQ